MNKNLLQKIIKKEHKIDIQIVVGRFRKLNLFILIFVWVSFVDKNKRTVMSVMFSMPRSYPKLWYKTNLLKEHESRRMCLSRRTISPLLLMKEILHIYSNYIDETPLCATKTTHIQGVQYQLVECVSYFPDGFSRMNVASVIGIEMGEMGYNVLLAWESPLCIASLVPLEDCACINFLLSPFLHDAYFSLYLKGMNKSEFAVESKEDELLSFWEGHGEPPSIDIFCFLRRSLSIRMRPPSSFLS